MILSTAERYIFILALVLIVLAYSAGGKVLLQAGGPQAANLLEVAQGRNPATGQFANYPGGVA
jgi:hypothetical protein